MKKKISRALNMYIDLSELKNKKHGRKELNLEISKESFNDNGEVIKFLKPIKFNGILRLVDNIYTLVGKVEVEVLLACSRCSESFSNAISFEVEEKFSHTIKDIDGEIISLDSDKLDLYQIIENNLVIELPVKRLCGESCKGLCQQCGTNLNKSQCNCDEVEVDPRLAKLKELFSNS
ncbi:MAG: YceD family protein [Clostridium sp.]